MLIIHFVCTVCIPDFAAWIHIVPEICSIISWTGPRLTPEAFTQNSLTAGKLKQNIVFSNDCITSVEEGWKALIPVANKGWITLTPAQQLTSSNIQTNSILSAMLPWHFRISLFPSCSGVALASCIWYDYKLTRITLMHICTSGAQSMQKYVQRKASFFAHCEETLNKDKPCGSIMKTM